MKFNDLFDAWAPVYDQTVYDPNNEYSEVFENYTELLSEICLSIADNKNGITLEIGTGTGNLAKELLDNGFRVMCIEPSAEMRLIAEKKLPSSVIIGGDFLNLPLSFKIDSIVSSYAFHHLTYDEKVESIKYLDGFLKPNGKIVIADTMFSSPQYKNDLLNYVERSKAYNLLRDLNTEYYEYIGDMLMLFKDLDYSLEYRQVNKYVWIIVAAKLAAR